MERSIFVVVALALVASCQRPTTIGATDSRVASDSPAPATSSSSLGTPMAPPSATPSGASAVDTSPPKVRPTPRTDCRRPLTELCRSGPCPTRAQATAELRSLVGRYKATDSGCLWLASLGRCGGLHVVAEADGYTSATRYFNDSGVLVGGVRTSDTNSYCNGTSRSAIYGNVPECEQKVGEDLCAGVARRDDGL